MKKIFSSLFFYIVALTFFSEALPCTGIQLKSVDNNYVSGRTIEFGLDLQLNGIIVPRNYTFYGTLPDGSQGLKYISKYAAIGGVIFSENAIADGINEKGLVVGDFYFPGFAEYAPINQTNKNKALSPTEFSNWILTQFATVDEVKEGIKSIVIAPTQPKGWPVIPPFHYIVYDKSGKSIVIEPINGKLKVYENPLGILTNSPTFDWHVLNIGNYLNLSAVNPPPRDINGIKIEQFGQGSGLHGLPGDFTSSSRFIRAVIFSYLAIPPKSAEQAVFQVFHILNQFDIPLGSVREIKSNQVAPEYTLGTVVRDPKNLRFYFKTYNNQNIQKVDLRNFDWNAKQLKRFTMQSEQQVTLAPIYQNP